MPLQQRAFLNELQAMVHVEDGLVEVHYDARSGFGTLGNCQFEQMSLEEAIGGAPETLEEGDSYELKVSDHAFLLVTIKSLNEHDGYYFAEATFVVEADYDKQTPLFACPVCGNEGPFEAFPPTKFVMDSFGNYTLPEDGDLDTSSEENGVLTKCESCGYEGDRQDFNSDAWFDLSEQ